MLNDPDMVDLERLVASDPANVLVRQQLAEALLNSGNASGALAHARILLTVNPHHPTVLGLAAMAADLSGDQVAGLTFGAALRSVQALSGAVPGVSEARRGGLRHGATRVGGLGAGQSISLLRIADVVGLAEERRRIADTMIGPWSEALRTGVGLPGGVLLYGPPSSGKRYLAETVAGELGVTYAEIDLADMVDPWGDAGASQLTAAFEAANEAGPSVIVLANVEVATHRRLRYSANGRKVLTDLLAALDRRDPTKVFVVATSAAPWLIQPILRTPGRFSEAVLVGPPDQRAREHLIARSLQRRGIAHDVDAEAAAATLQGCSVGDLETVLDAASAKAYTDSTSLGRVVHVRQAHIEYASIDCVRGANAWFDTAYNFPEFTDDSTQFDPLFDYIRRHVRRS